MTTLEKIRDEIEEKEKNTIDWSRSAGLIDALEIIDKYAEQEPCDDAISREDAIHAFDYLMGLNRAQIQDILFKLPPVRPQQKIVQCSQCKYAEVADSEDSQDGYTCQFHRGSIWFSGSYCSWAERRQNG